jgi:hypothetical protein
MQSKYTGVFVNVKLRAALEKMAERNKLTLSEQIRRLLVLGVAEDLIGDDAHDAR